MKRMDGLVDDGFVIIGGPIGDGEQTLHVVRAADESEIRARLAGDPWASAGLLRIGTIERWALWLAATLKWCTLPSGYGPSLPVPALAASTMAHWSSGSAHVPWMVGPQRPPWMRWRPPSGSVARR